MDFVENETGPRILMLVSENMYKYNDTVSNVFV